MYKQRTQKNEHRTNPIALFYIRVFFPPLFGWLKLNIVFMGEFSRRSMKKKVKTNDIAVRNENER